MKQWTGERPVAIGGVGGSGTRLLAQCLQQLGVRIGDDLNEACDNLWFTLLFKRAEILTVPDDDFDELVEIFLTGMRGENGFSRNDREIVGRLTAKDRPQHPSVWLAEKARRLLDRKIKRTEEGPWGWKEPNTHVVLERLWRRLPHMKYIHLIRNGLDMAYSRNQNQLRFWGRQVLGEGWDDSPRSSLKFWRIANQKAIGLGRTFPDKFLLLNFDRFCSHPREGLLELLAFTGLDRPGEIPRLLELVRIPGSIGRHKQYDRSDFDPEDTEYVRALGFDV